MWNVAVCKKGGNVTFMLLRSLRSITKRNLSTTVRLLNEEEPPVETTEQNVEQEAAAKPKPKETVGFIGLGNMGHNMGMNLLKGGYNLVVYDVYPEAVEPFKALGATAVTTPRLVAQQVKKNNYNVTIKSRCKRSLQRRQWHFQGNTRGDFTY